ncbi:bifunctional 3,4-dihydroxy-2-butanone-4-phosphate synthase/GTP cyclohydrolase II [Methylophaga thalassica]|uniref:bifunctional 3,4-dihydroxy-2-butanone-4-phosphate synthase/GTP cyclohydrolase II n=1 Tax=Methylophaga aminisulfidivorans TaxID=230105 RepID=UPI003A945CFB
MSQSKLNSISRQPKIASIEAIIEDIRQGKMVVLMDDEDRENEGDLIMAASHVTADAVNFMAMHARGLICLTLTEQRCQQLNLPLMVRENKASLATNFTVSIEAAEGVTTGISTHDRALTIQAAVAANASADDIVSPGHIFPLMARSGGVLARAGHTEAGCDLAALAGEEPAAVICEIMNEDGTMARLPELLEFAEQHDLKVGTIADLIEYRHQHEQSVIRLNEREMHTMLGSFRRHDYLDKTTGMKHLALVYGTPAAGEETLVRVHAPFNSMDLLDYDRNGHTWSVAEAMQYIQQQGSGVLVLLHGNEEEWHRLIQSERNYADEFVLKHYGIGAQILRDLGVTEMRLMTWPRKLPSMSGFGLSVTDYVLPTDLAEKLATSAVI